MSAIIWWLESPWHLRALVFLLSFFLCFVAPWLYSQGWLGERKLPDEKPVAVLAPKPPAVTSDRAQKSAAQQAQALAQLPEAGPAPVVAHEDAAQLRAPAQALVGSRPAETVASPHEQSSAHPTQSAAQAEVRHDQAPAQLESHAAKAVPDQGQESPASPQNLAAPVPPPAAHAEADASPAQARPAVEVEAAAAPAKPEDKPLSPAEPKAPAEEKQAAVVPELPSTETVAGSFIIDDRGSRTLAAASGRSVEVQRLAVSSESGGSADVAVYRLPSEAGPRRSAILDSDAFAKAAASYDTFACIGLLPPNKAGSAGDVSRLLESGAVKLCGVIARKPYVSANAKLYGVPVDALPLAPSDKQKAQTLQVVIGLKNAKGDLTNAAVQKKLVSEIVKNGKILKLTAEAAPETELHYIEVKCATATPLNRPVKSHVVKRSTVTHEQSLRQPYGSQQHRNAAKKISHARATAEKRNAFPGCRVLDFSF